MTERREIRLQEMGKDAEYGDFVILIWADFELGKSKHDIVNMLIGRGLSERVATAYVEKFIASASKVSDVYGSLLN